MNILYIDHGGYTSDDHIYQYYGDLLRQLRTMANVSLYEGQTKNLPNMLSQSEIDFDCIIFGLGYFAQSNPESFEKIEGLAELTTPVVCMLHKPQNMLEEKLKFCASNKVDILLDYFGNAEKNVATRSPRSWFTANPETFHPRDIPVVFDIGFSGADHGRGKIKGATKDLRSKVGEFLKGNKKYKTFWNSSYDLSYRIPSVEEYASKINSCKIWLATTGPVDDISPRYFEVALSKTLLFCNDMPKVNHPVFIDGETCVTFANDMSDFEQKLDYYLENDLEREKIVNNTYDLVYNNYTWNHMAKNLLEEIRK
jgi:glycosyltransferase involved in cell wall biosynthesis